MLPRPRNDPKRFVPRATLVLVGGFLLFFVVSLLYALPVFFDPVPAGATPDYLAERVRARLQGKAILFMALSVLAVAVLSTRPWKR